MISPCPPYYSSALSCLLRSHHVLLFRLVAYDCLSCSAKLGRCVLSSSLALSFSMPLASCLHLLSCYSARILSALLCHEAASTVIAEIFVRVKISYSSARELSYAINFRTARAMSHTLVCVHSFRMLLNFFFFFFFFFLHFSLSTFKYIQKKTQRNNNKKRDRHKKQQKVC